MADILTFQDSKILFRDVRDYGFFSFYLFEMFDYIMRQHIP